MTVFPYAHLTLASGVEHPRVRVTVDAGADARDVRTGRIVWRTNRCEITAAGPARWELTVPGGVAVLVELDRAVTPLTATATPCGCGGTPHVDAQPVARSWWRRIVPTSVAAVFDPSIYERS